MQNNTSKSESSEIDEQAGSSRGTAGEAAPFLLTRSDQKVVCVVCVILLLWAGWRWVDLSRWGSRDIERQNQRGLGITYLIDINKANWVEYAMLDGIGEVLAKRIVEFRETHGPFNSVEDLQKVKGIGKKTFEKIEPFLVLRIRTIESD